MTAVASPVGEMQFGLVPDWTGVPKVDDRRRTPPTARGAATGPTPELSARGSPRADLASEKVNNLDPMAPRPRQKRQLPAPPVVAVAVRRTPYYPEADSQLQV